MNAPEVMDAVDAAELLSISRVTMIRLARDGRVPGRKVGREWRFSRQALHNWLAGNQPQAADEERERQHLQLVATSAGFVQGAIRQGAR